MPTSIAYHDRAIATARSSARSAIDCQPLRPLSCLIRERPARGDSITTRAWPEAIQPCFDNQLRGGARTATVLNGLPITVSVSYTHLRAHETPEHLVCRL